MELYNHDKGSGVFIQIGAGAGDLDQRANCRDGFTEFIKKLPRERVKKIILVEPNPLNITMLRECWRDYPEAIIHEIAIVPKTHTDCTVDVYYHLLDGPHYQVSSIKKNHLYQFYGNNCELQKFTSPVKYLCDFVNENAREEIELLALDIEGVDGDILLETDFSNLNLKYLSFEYVHLRENENNVCDHLKKNGYKRLGSGLDYNGLDLLYINERFTTVINTEQLMGERPANTLSFKETHEVSAPRIGTDEFNTDNARKIKIVDAFIFYNELDLLNYRLEVLSPYVDYFVIVESTYTHNGVQKPLYFNDNKDRFSKFLHKIQHVIMDDFPHKHKVSDGRQWENEKFQRNVGIPRGLKLLENNISLDDYVICSDLDEIVNPQILQDVKNCNIIDDFYALEMDLYYYNLTNYFCKWNYATLLKVKTAMQTCHRLEGKILLKNAGWHLSYFGDFKFIKNKLEHFAHQEFNEEQYTNEEHINTAIKEGKDILNRPNEIFKKIKICDNPNLPPRMDLITKYWENLS